MHGNYAKYLAKENKIFLAIGNSRLHWAWFINSKLNKTWDTQYLLKPVESYKQLIDLLNTNLIVKNLQSLSIYIASVVPQQTKLWSKYPNSNLISLKDIRLQNIYPTLGIDRALAAWGGGETYGYPCLIIDGGTALTFTAVNKHKELVGGAILPGLRSQFLTLKQKTAALPNVELPTTLPPRWAMDTEKAIASGVIHTTIAGIYSYITDWQQQHPDSQIILTGGDAKIIYEYMQQQYPNLKSALESDRNLIFYGMKLAINER